LSGDLKDYQQKLAEQEKANRFLLTDIQNESALASALALALKKLPNGSPTASSYHSLMFSIVEFLFFPALNYPRKEREIHQGRKRVDITMNNAAVAGIFYLLQQVRQVPCPYVMFECKNYTTDIANPELDQMAGRFSPTRGQFGMICCRSFEDRSKFIERCRDTFRDRRGLIIPLDDEIVLQMLKLIENNKRTQIESTITSLIDDVSLS
jgi:hypothetical protein